MPRWEDNVRMDLKEIEVSARNWVDSSQDRRDLVNETWTQLVSQLVSQIEGRGAFKILTETLKERDLQESLYVDGRNPIRMDRKEIGVNKRNWVDSARDRDYYRVFVNAALSLRIP